MRRARTFWWEVAVGRQDGEKRKERSFGEDATGPIGLSYLTDAKCLDSDQKTYRDRELDSDYTNILSFYSGVIPVSTTPIANFSTRKKRLGSP